MSKSIRSTMMLPADPSVSGGPALAITTRRPLHTPRYPPLIFVHGAANSATVWTFWLDIMATLGWHGLALDLRGHGDSAFDDADDSLATSGMEDYADDVQRLVDSVGQSAVVMGWSMGGLVAMMAAARRGVLACVCLAPSAPTRRRKPATTPRSGVFGPEEYGLTSDDPNDQPAMLDLSHHERQLALDSLGPESRYARDDRKAGIIVSKLPCPLLIVTGALDRRWPAAAYDDLGLNADHLTDDNAGHWGLVLRRATVSRLAPAVDSWLRATLSPAGPVDD